jgi:subtilase family serine protease
MLQRVPRSTHLNLAIGLPLRNQDGLELLLQQLSDPTSPNYQQYLTPEQFTEQFGPTEEDYKALIDFA